jgi:N-carbamoylputrescine amidase
MPRVVRCAVTQAANVLAPDKASLSDVREAMVEKHVRMIGEAAQKGVQIIALQELFYGPYFAAEQDTRWYEFTEKVPDGPIVRRMQELARKHEMAMVVPVYEVEATGVFYNTAAVLDADGTYLGKYRKNHIPHCLPAFWEKFYFKPGNLGYPVFKTRYATIGVYICYDRHFPEGGRLLGLHGAEIVFIPSATTSGHSDNLWKIEQTSMAIANGYFVGTNNRVGREAPWNFGEFYGSSYFCDPYGQILSQGSRDKDEVVVADLDLDMIQKVRAHWQFYRDRRPESYGDISSDVL